jgi:hypothetical protein
VRKALGKSFLGRIDGNLDDKIRNGYCNKFFEDFFGWDSHMNHPVGDI